MESIINHLKSIGYVYADYSNKIKTNEDFLQFLFKILEPKYAKCVFYIYIKNVPQELKTILQKCYDTTSNSIIIFNKDNYKFFLEDEGLPILLLNVFLEQGNTLYKCNICFEENFTEIVPCSKCSFQSCKNCCFKSNMSSLQERNITLKCSVCKTVIGRITIKK